MTFGQLVRRIAPWMLYLALGLLVVNGLDAGASHGPTRMSSIGLALWAATLTGRDRSRLVAVAFAEVAAVCFVALATMVEAIRAATLGTPYDWRWSFRDVAVLLAVCAFVSYFQAGDARRRRDASSSA